MFIIKNIRTEDVLFVQSIELIVKKTIQKYTCTCTGIIAFNLLAQPKGAIFYDI